MITKDSVLAQLTAENEVEARAVRVHGIIANFLYTSYKGDTLTKRFATALAKRTGWTVRWNVGMVMLEVQVSGGDSGYTDQENKKFTLCYPRDNDAAKGFAKMFEEADGCHGKHAEARIAERSAFMASGPALAHYVFGVNDALAAVANIRNFTRNENSLIPAHMVWEARKIVAIAIKSAHI